MLVPDSATVLNTTVDLDVNKVSLSLISAIINVSQSNIRICNVYVVLRTNKLN